MHRAARSFAPTYPAQVARAQAQGYARFLRTPITFANLRTTSTGFNSLTPMAANYRAMLGKWNSMGSPRPRAFTVAQIKEMLS